MNAGKRRKRARDRSISPPPIRRKLNPTPTDPVTTSSSSNSHPSIPASPKGRLHIISWNVNGISHLLPPKQKSITSFFNPATPQAHCSDSASDTDISGKKSPLRNFLKRHDFPALLCLQEVKIPPKDETTRSAVEKAANHGDGPKYHAHFELPRDKYNARGWGGKVYGVCTLVRDDLLSRGDVKTMGVEWDQEGRVLSTEFERWRLVVINGYWPNGTMNPWKDSETGIVKGTRHDMKRNFHSLMLGEVKRYESRGWDVVLVGDMNIARSSVDGYPGIRLGVEHVRNRADFNEKFFESEDGMRGVDSWREIHGEKRGYSYHGERAEEWGRSCDRVDLGIVSSGLVERGGLVGADIWESVMERGGSDHVPIGIVLDMGD
ncbi:exodeoxyribonuclease III [Cadophora sp. MPI-SDFR-AT-0126]|nr:exodeoxyribonuclease III [Leotiomycetes sp. MPI-SDFR-AT-0126]